MKILVTGGNSMVGKHLKDILPNAIYISSKDGDLRDINECNKLIKIHKPEIVIHLAAKVGGIKSNLTNPVEYFEDNILINTNILKASYQYDVKRFIGILSTCAYPDKVDYYPMMEKDLHKGPPSESNLGYSYAKRCLALQIEAYNKQYGTKYQYLIPSNLYSEYDNKLENESHFINSLIHKIIKAKNGNENKIELWGTGQSLRQCTYAFDLAKIIKYVIENNITESFNVSNPENYKICELARMALDETSNSKIGAVFKSNDYKLDGQLRKDVSIEKMLKFIPNYKFISFKEGIKQVYNKLNIQK